MTLQATLTTDRLTLRPRSPEDLEACYAMNMEPGTVDHVRFPRDGSWADETAHRAFLEETLAHKFPNGLGYWTVTLRDERTFLGWVIMAPEDMLGPDVEIGWRFLTANHGKGYATEAARGVVAHGFRVLGLSHVIADINPDNAASRNVARKLGMRLPDGGTNVWRLTREDWLAANG